MNVFKVSSSRLAKNALLRIVNTRNVHTSLALQEKRSYYEVLRVTPNASQTEIKEAYYKLSKVYHPDIAKDENSHRMFRSITEAYDTLGNIKSRIQYDRETGIPTTAAEAPSGCTSGIRDAESGVLCPDYDKILGNKTTQEAWEDSEYRDRRIEVVKSKNRWYMDEPGYLREYGEVKLIKGGLALGVVLCFLFNLDIYLDKMGLP